MKRNLPLNLFILPFLLALSNYSAAQCASGWNEATLNWDQMDYLTTAGSYAGFVTTSMRDTQFFTIGVNRVKFKLNGITTAGENGTNTAEAGSYGTGHDVEYGSSGTVEITFDAPVNNLRFSLYDIDANQRIVITATDAAGNPLAVNMARLSAGILTITGSGTTTATAQASATGVGNNDVRGTVNIDIDGGTAGVKTVLINSNGAAGNFWLSDLTACVQGAFPKNYYASQKPFNGQPAYYLVTPDNNSVYLFNPTTGVSDWLFSENESPWINSMAYDPVNHIVYYVRDNPSPDANNKMLKKYDVTTGTISVVIDDITKLGIPVYEIVVESAGAAFYNGSLYLGVEGTNNRKNSNRESIVWRIDFDENLQPIAASQAFARPADNGSGTLTHDWGDFSIKDGILYDFNTGNVGSTSQFIHHDMQTGNAVIYATNGNPAPIQVGQTWDGKLYWTGGQGNEQGRVAIYNENGTIGPKINATVTKCSPAWQGRAGDASDPFKPQSDFGDAPASYDPAGVDPATHEYDCNLRFGPSYDREWDKNSSSDGTGDGDDEDGIDFANLLTPGFTTFVQDVKVYNNTGSTATLVAWLDYNGDGVFSPGEGISRSVPSRTTMQTITLSWNNINVTISATNRTFMRLRISSASNNLTVNDPNGWFANGEVEDHIVPVDVILPVALLTFTAKNENDHRVLLEWTTENEANLEGYAIERSADGINWTSAGFVPGKSSSGVNTYHWYDYDPLPAKSYYRLKMTDEDGRVKYSWMISVETAAARTSSFRVLPNPVRSQATVEFTANVNDAVTVQLINTQGRVLQSRSLTAHAGLNKVSFAIPDGYTNGVYIIQLITPKGSRQTKLLVSK